jgi:phosphoribosylamine--glycine ligase
MDTLIVGKGGREHALAMACRDTSADLFFTEANAGMEQIGTNLKLDTIDDTAKLASDLQIDLAVIGPENLLASGMADALRYYGVPTLGFGGQAAQLESSKAFADKFMKEFDIVHPPTAVKDDIEDALRFVEARDPEGYVIKADGLAGGKGVSLPEDKGEAERIVRDMMSGKLFGVAGRRILLQERYSGEEVSMIALFDGQKAKVLFLAQDYKRLREKDEGPNTGGMGSYAPVPPEIANERQVEKMYETLDKTLDGLKSRGFTDPGVIYLGFMLADQLGGDPAVMEYNVRFGDPETQAGLTLLKDEGVDVHELFGDAANGGLEGQDRITSVKHTGRAAVTVCMATYGYPDAPRIGDPIEGLDLERPGVTVHHGGTLQDEKGRILTDGGRAIYVTGLGDSIRRASETAYQGIGTLRIHFEDMQVRKDIGARAIEAVEPR